MFKIIKKTLFIVSLLFVFVGIALEAQAMTRVIDSPVVIASDRTIPSTTVVKFVHPGRFVIEDYVTLTINGPIEAGLFQIFEYRGEGKVVLASGSVKEVYPQWWGAKGDGVTDDTAAIQAAIDAVGGMGGGIVF